MTKEFPLSRREVLKTTGIALTSLSAANTVTAKTNPAEIVRTINLDVSQINHVDSARIELYDDGSQAIEAQGTEVPVSSEGIPGLMIGTENHYDSAGNYRPGDVEARVETGEQPPVDRLRGRSGGSKSDFATGTQPDSGPVSKEGVSASASGDLDDTDSGTDYTTDYEGGLQVTQKESDDWNDINHGQTSRWSESGGEVTSYSDRYWCWYVGPAADDAEHQAGGFTETDWSGDTLYSKSYSQYYRNLGYSEYHSYLYAALTMKPSGQMDWWGRSTTSGVGDQYDPPTSHFSLKTDYWTYCKDWAT